MSGEAWRARAPELTDFTLLHLVNRWDSRGGYLEFARRTVDENGVERKIYTAPKKEDRGKRDVVTRYIIERHYQGASEGHVIGLHSTSAENTSRWLAFDLDNHERTAEKAAENLSAALLLCDVLRAFGLAPLIEDSDGHGGLHVWVIFCDPVETYRVHAFMVAVLAELKIAAECYPKQPKLRPEQLGNWLRIPGLHHTRKHWSRFLAEGVWHDGEDAVDLWLNAWTSPSDQLPIPKPARSPTPYIVPRVSSAPLDYRIRAYMAKLPAGLAGGEGRNNAGYLFACFMVNDLGLPDADALGWLAEWNATHRTPMSEGKLRDLIGDAHRYGKHARGSAA